MEQLTIVRDDMIDESHRLYHAFSGNHDPMLKAMMRRYVTVGATSTVARYHWSLMDGHNGRS